MRTVADTAKKMTTLMSKLSLKSFTPMPVATPEPMDMSTLIDEMVAPIRGEGDGGTLTSPGSLFRRSWPFGSKFTKCC